MRHGCTIKDACILLGRCARERSGLVCTVDSAEPILLDPDFREVEVHHFDQAFFDDLELKSDGSKGWPRWLRFILTSTIEAGLMGLSLLVFANGLPLTGVVIATAGMLFAYIDGTRGWSR